MTGLKCFRAFSVPQEMWGTAGSATLFRKGHPFTLRMEVHTEECDPKSHPNTDEWLLSKFHDEMLFARLKEMMELDQLPPIIDGHSSKHTILRVGDFPH